MNKERLLNVARALRESPNPNDFTMQRYGHGCGAPACAIGHYAARADLQSEFALRADGLLKVLDGTSCVAGALAVHFDITLGQHDELFEGDGCDDAKTAIEAASYIERFVREHA